MQLDAATASAQVTRNLEDQVAPWVPAGYAIQEIKKVPSTENGDSQYLVALSDSMMPKANNPLPNEIIVGVPSKPPELLLVKVAGSAILQDQIVLHKRAQSCMHIGEPPEPNYLGSIEAEDVGDGKLFLVHSTYSGGGSGGFHYFDLYRVEHNKLKQLATYSHDRLVRSYFTIFNHAIYDGQLSCARGEKHGAAYVYTCGIDVTKYIYDGNSIQPAGTERMHERKGNRFLNEKYWMMSVQNALGQREIFANP